MKPMLKARGTMRSKLKYDKLHSKSAFNFNSRRYTMAWKHVDGSKVHEDLPSYPLPNGLRGHFYDRGNETIDEVTAPAAAPPDRPLTLLALLQAGGRDGS